MKRNKHQIAGLVFAIVFVFFGYYILGGLGSIIAYEADAPFSYIKLFFIHLVIFLTSAWIIKYLLLVFLSMPNHKRIVLAALISLSTVLAAQVVLISDKAHGVGMSYILLGDYLRDNHGVNIYFMDWGGWIFSATFFLTIIFSFAAGWFIKSFGRGGGGGRH